MNITLVSFAIPEIRLFASVCGGLFCFEDNSVGFGREREREREKANV